MDEGNSMTIKDIVEKQEFREVTVVKADDKKRITVKVADSKYYAIYINEDGQIFLDPRTFIPTREAWLHKNPKALKAVLEGLKQSAAGEATEMESMAQYSEDEIE